MSEGFSLLLLEESEVLLESAACVKHAQTFGGELSGAGDVKEESGRIYVCSLSLFFEPKEADHAIERFAYKNMESPPEVVGHDGASLLAFSASKWQVMKIKGQSTPYRTVSAGIQVGLDLIHRELSTGMREGEGGGKGTEQGIVGLIRRLWESVKAPLRERTVIVDKICQKRMGKPFDMSRLASFREKVLTARHIEVVLVSKLINIPGCIVITDARFYFQPSEVNNVGEVVQSYPIKQLRLVYKRRYMLRQSGLEVCFDDKMLLFSFTKGVRQRDEIYDILNTHPVYVKIKSKMRKSEGRTIEDFTSKWQRREISNYDYLLKINALADRSVNDLTQYPVFPWIVQDYTSSTLDLENPATFRDLSKPIGALNPSRLQGFHERFNHMKLDKDSVVPAFLYGTHYSTPGYVLYYLVRQNPDLMLHLQNGKFDDPDRAFHSVEETWRSVLANPADIKELIPEFYSSDGSFLVNSRGLDLGTKQNGQDVQDVKLPPWAATPEDFIEKNRRALESEHVSANLHQWIDLIFGYKQRGEEAVRADNLFYYLTYEGAVDIESIEDPNEKQAIQVQIYEFGQTPKQIFSKAHPSRNAKLESKQIDTEVATNTNQSHRSTAAINQDTRSQKPRDSAPVVRDAQKEREVVNERIEHDLLAHTSLSEPVRVWSCKNVSVSNASVPLKAHRNSITAVCLAVQQDVAYTVSSDKFLTMVDVVNNKIKRRALVSRLALSSCELLDESRTLVMGSWDNAVYVYSIEYARLKSRFVCHDDAVAATSLAKRKPSLLATASWDSSVKLWDLEQASQGCKPQSTFFDHDGPVRSVELNEVGNLVVSSSDSGTVVVRDVRCYEPIQIFEPSASDCSSLSVTWLKNDNAILHTTTNGALQVYDMHSSKLTPVVEKEAISDNGSRLSCCVLSSDKRCALLGDTQGKLSICSLDAFQEESTEGFIQLRSPDGNGITSAALERDKVALGLGTGDVTFLDLRY